MIRKCLDYSPYRKYVQFADLVFDTESNLDSASYTVSTKTESQPYSWGHGSYTPFKNKQQFLNEGDISISAIFDYRLYRREDRKFIKDWIKINILKPGRIWAIENNKLIWAYAYLTDYSEPYEEFHHTFSIDLDFKLHEGVWHIADTHKTFLIPYDSCNIMDCLDFEEDDDCSTCCETCLVGKEQDCDNCLCECGQIDKESSLCAFDRAKLFSEFMQCGHSWKIIYDCNKGNKFFGDEAKGIKICKDDICRHDIAGKFYSHTIVESDLVDVILHGSFMNPSITINDSTMELGLKFDGTLHIYSDGTITYQCDPCAKEESVDINDVEINGDLGWMVHHGKNRLIVKGACDCTMACAWVHVDELTI